MSADLRQSNKGTLTEHHNTSDRSAFIKLNPSSNSPQNAAGKSQQPKK